MKVYGVTQIDVSGSYDVIGKITFGEPTGYMKAGKDFNNLIKRQQQFFSYVNVVRTSLSFISGLRTEMTAGFSNAGAGQLHRQKPHH
jgi:hypothetical protein